MADNSSGLEVTNSVGYQTNVNSKTPIERKRRDGSQSWQRPMQQ